MVDLRPHDNTTDGFDFGNFSLADSSQFRIHEKWNGNDVLAGNDIAIIEFPEGADFGIVPVQLASDYIEYENDPGVIAGYGVMFWNGKLLYVGIHGFDTHLNKLNFNFRNKK